MLKVEGGRCEGGPGSGAGRVGHSRPREVRGAARRNSGDVNPACRQPGHMKHAHHGMYVSPTGKQAHPQSTARAGSPGPSGAHPSGGLWARVSTPPGPALAPGALLSRWWWGRAGCKTQVGSTRQRGRCRSEATMEDRVPSYPDPVLQQGRHRAPRRRTTFPPHRSRSVARAPCGCPRPRRRRPASRERPAWSGEAASTRGTAAVGTASLPRRPPGTPSCAGICRVSPSPTPAPWASPVTSSTRPSA